MRIDGWDIDETEVLDSSYGEGTIFTVADLINYVVSHPLEFKPKVRCTCEKCTGLKVESFYNDDEIELVE